MVPSPIQPRRKPGTPAWWVGVLLAGVLLSFPSVAWGDPNIDLREWAIVGYTAGVKAALTAGADVNARNTDGITALMRAASDDHAKVISLLLKAGADVNAKDNDGSTALMDAASNDYPNIVSLLLKAGADVNARDNLGFTALEIARGKNKSEIISLIQDYVHRQNQASSQQSSTGSQTQDSGVSPDHNATAPSPGLSSQEARQIADRAAQKATEETRAKYDKKIKELKDQIRPKSQSGSSDAKMQEILVLIKSLQKKKNSLPAPPTYHSSVDRPDYRDPENPHMYAVVIGVEHYPGGIPDARFADRDAKAMVRHLVALGVPPDHIRRLSDGTATRGRMKEALKWLRRNATPDSVLWVYFSGHGAPGLHGHAYLVPFGADPNDLGDTGYREDRLYRQLNGIPAKRAIVALDTCFSGQGNRSVLGKNVRPLLLRHREGFFPTSGKIVAFSAAKATQEAGTRTKAGHGLFTYYFLKGLNGGAVRNDRVTVGSLYRYLKVKVPEAANLDNRSQTPVLMPASDRAVGGVILR